MYLDQVKAYWDGRVQDGTTSPPTIVALLDMPKPSSFACVPLVVKDHTGDLCVEGFDVSKKLSPEDLRRLIEEGHALKVNIEITFDTYLGNLPSNIRAGWIGAAFAEKAEALNCPTPTTNISRWSSSYPLVLELEKICDDDGELLGSLWIDTPGDIHALQKRWVEMAANMVIGSGPEFKDKARGLAELMGWCLPDSDETCAAAWYTSNTKEEMAAEVAWLARLARDNGHEMTSEMMLKKIIETQREVMSRNGTKMYRVGETT